MTKLQWKWIGILFLMALSAVLLSSTFSWYGKSEDERDLLEKAKQRPTWLLNLGLDLRGGSHVLMELEVDKLDPPPQSTKDIHDALERAIEVLRNRIDAFGVSEPLIAKQGERWVVIQLPGSKDPKAVKNVIGKTALLEFNIVDDGDKAIDALNELRKTPMPYGKDGEGPLDPKIAKLLPEGTKIIRGREEEYYVVKAKAGINGAFLKDARVDMQGDFGFPNVSFQFNPEGAQIFGDLTRANVQKRMAIVLDGVVQSAPVIEEPIPGGNGIIRGNFTKDEAKFLTVILRAGALPAPLRIIEERTVGPTLGEDSIKAGMHSFLIGLALVISFMILYYKLSGLVAGLALLLNLLFMLAGMAYFNATLTLPGIAGVILTIGMSVDANVLIFERIREELRLSKPVRIALDAGYDKAMSAILDGNITTLIAALFLFQFGTGPIKGFAVTLTLGLCVSLFTAVIVTRTILETFLAAPGAQKLSI